MRLREAIDRDDEALINDTLERASPAESPEDARRLASQIAGPRVVMLGEASHGTREFYEHRAELTKLLIQEHGYQFIAVEGDWPPCWKLNNFIHGKTGGSARDMLRSFDRWPTWMWANEEISELAGWLRAWNENSSAEERASFYGLDVYSFFESVDSVIAQLKRINPFLAKIVQARYACLEPFGRDERSYAKSLVKFPDGCRDEITRTLRDLLDHRLDSMGKLASDHDSLFDARQNARVVENAEDYYRTMIHGDEDSWNVRDRHMLETLQTLLDRHGPYSKGIVWAHNTHIGDYIATDMPRYGQINLGGLARETWGKQQVSLVGYGTYEGEVAASHAWDGPIEILPVPRGRSGSVEAAFHKVCAKLGAKAFHADLSSPDVHHGPLAEVRGHRAIGVVYNPAHEQYGNYVPTSLSRRYDHFIFFDRSRAVTPLQQSFRREEIPETWPLGM